MTPEEAPSTTVTFALTGQTYPWTADSTNLLDFAEQHGIDISAGCRYGDCGTCQTEIVSGQVQYLHETGAEPDPGTCLPCSCRPASSIVLDA